MQPFAFQKPGTSVDGLLGRSCHGEMAGVILASHPDMLVLSHIMIGKEMYGEVRIVWLQGVEKLSRLTYVVVIAIDAFDKRYPDGEVISLLCYKSDVIQNEFIGYACI